MLGRRTKWLIATIGSCRLQNFMYMTCTSHSSRTAQLPQQHAHCMIIARKFCTSYAVVLASAPFSHHRGPIHVTSISASQRQAPAYHVRLLAFLAAWLESAYIICISLFHCPASQCKGKFPPPIVCDHRDICNNPRCSRRLRLRNNDRLRSLLTFISGFMNTSEDSSEVSFLLVENYNYDCSCWSSDRQGIFGTI
jgi:hypothetical protein